MLGDNSNTAHLVPTAVSTSVVFATISAGASHTCGLSTDNVAYCWGSNAEGQLGTGALNDPPAKTPTAVAGGLKFLSISAGSRHTCALDLSYHGYCWGNNDYGTLGDGTTTKRAAPTAVIGGLTFTYLLAGADATCGTGYCWGSNAYGQLGSPTFEWVTVPSAVSGGHSFRSLAGGSGAWCGVTIEGAGYCWGQVNQFHYTPVLVTPP
jgi:alpha-tubulin suppressor-like RCC1 family protein